jgi:hypothetical protein
MKHSVLLLLAIFKVIMSLAAPCPNGLSGTYKIGASGDYVNLTIAINDLKVKGLAGPVVFELQGNYSSTTETFPVTIPGLSCANATNTLTIRPATGAQVVISNPLQTAVLLLNGASYVTIDGRPGGTGTTKGLTIQNTSSQSGLTVQMQDSCSHDVFRYTDLQGTSGNNNGLLTIVNSVGQDNTIENCRFESYTGSWSGLSTGIGIYASGASSFNTVNNCEFLSCYNAIFASDKCSNWNITGNQIYDKGTSGATYCAIDIQNTTGSGFNITDNYLGGTAPFCGGAQPNYTFYQGIEVSTGTDHLNNIERNTIGNIHIQAADNIGFHGIMLQGGNANCSGNNIGKNITASTSNSGTFTGIITSNIYVGSSEIDTLYISNNKISGMQFSGNGGDMHGIDIESNGASVYADIENNTITDLTCNVGLFGIFVRQPGLTLIKGNSIYNLNGVVQGIVTEGGRPQILNNTIHHLYTSSYATDNSAYGILVYGPASGMNISGNVVHTIIASVTDPVGYGPYTSSAYGITVENCDHLTLNANDIHTLVINSKNGTSEVVGVSIKYATNTVFTNNMLSLGYDTLGKNVTGIFTGLLMSSNGLSVLNNSLFLAGAGTAANNAALIQADNLPISVLNNIFVNNRTLQPPVYAAYTNQALTLVYNNAASKIDYNDYYGLNIKDTNRLAMINGAACLNMADIRKATKADSNSFSYDPHFVNVVTGDLHLSNPTPAEGSGISDPLVTTDIDGDNRSAYSPADIGADAGNYTYQSGEAPIITHQYYVGHPLLSNSTYQARVVKKIVGIDTTGDAKPRMVIRVMYPQTGPWFATPGKLISGDLHDGTWSFTPDLSKAGVTLAEGDSLEYYIAAQDKGPVANVGYSDDTIFYRNPDYPSVTKQDTLPRLLLYSILPDTVYVGDGQKYTSLTNEGGFFQAANTNMFDTTKTNVYVVITSDIAETGAYSFTNLNTNIGTRITICTNTPVLKTLKKINTDTKYNPLMLLNKTNNVTIDGSVNGEGRYLKLVYENDLNNYDRTCLYLNASNNFELKNTIVASNNLNAVTPGSLYVTGYQHNLLIRDNLFTNIDPAAGKNGLPQTAIYLWGLFDTATIRHNEITNFSRNAIFAMQPQANGPFCRIFIDSNHIYSNFSVVNTDDPVVMDIRPRNAYIDIHDNYIGGTAPYCGGDRWVVRPEVKNKYTYPLTAISVNALYNDTVLVRHNTIQHISLAHVLSGGLFTGISYVNATSPAYITDNLIGSETEDSSIAAAGVNAVNVTGGIHSTISGNTLSNLWCTGIVKGIAFIRPDVYNGIQLSAAIDNNKLSRFTGLNIVGIYTVEDTGTIRNNNISGMHIVSAGYNYECTGISVYYSARGVYNANLYADNPILVTGNRIHDLRSDIDGYVLSGIKLTYSSALVANNLISLNNHDTAVNDALRGIYLYTEPTYTIHQNSFIYYNNIYIGGHSKDTAGSAGIYNGSIDPLLDLRNNLVYNERTGGTGKHLAFTTTNSTLPAFANNASNNVYVGAVEWKGSDVTDIKNWQQLTGLDDASYISNTTDVPAANLFTAPANGDLHINTQSPLSWVVNGKGMPISSIDKDIDNDTRSVTTATGATDVGADEFNTSTTPPAMVITGSHTPGGTENLYYNDRLLASITWGASGTLPTLSTPLFYSGVWPTDATNGGTITSARDMNAYWQISASGSTGYTYNLTLHYDSSMLGRITDETAMVLNKKEIGVDGSWQELHPSLVDTLNKTVTVYNQTSFSQFTLTDSLATMAKPAISANLALTAVSVSSATVHQNDAFSLYCTEINNGQAPAKAHTIKAYLSLDAQLSPDDSLIKTLTVNSLAAGANTGQLTMSLQWPCGGASGDYYIMVVADSANLIPENNETDNTAFAALHIAPVSFNVTGLPATICAGTQFDLNTSGAANLTFTGPDILSKQDTGITVLPQHSGNYTFAITATVNGCTSTQTFATTVLPAPDVNASTSSRGACVGSAITVSATGASSYYWQGDDVPGNAGASFEVSSSRTGTHTYLLTGTDANGCKASASLSYNVDTAQTASVTIDYSGCPMKTLTFEASAVNGGNDPQYEWYVNNQQAGEGPTFVLHDATNQSVVYVMMTSNAGCVSTPTVSSPEAKINCVVTAVPVIDGMESYIVYPNPGDGLFNVHIKLNAPREVRLLVADATGRIIMVIPSTLKAGDVMIPVDVRHRPAGIYYIQATVGNTTFTSKVIKTPDL